MHRPRGAISSHLGAEFATLACMSDTVLTYLDTYCERAGAAGVLAEPLNAITNLCFIAVALWVALRLRRSASAHIFRPDLWLLALFLCSIGIGSGLWHTLPTHTTMLLDVIPIGLFVQLYLVSAYRRLIGYPWLGALVVWSLFVAVTLVAQKTLPPTLLNGTVMYLPPYSFLVLLTLQLARRGHAATRTLAGALAIWTVSLVCRTFDQAICPSFPLGTHFLWHTLNALTLWRLMLPLVPVRSAPQPA